METLKIDQTPFNEKQAKKYRANGASMWYAVVGGVDTYVKAYWYTNALAKFQEMDPSITECKISGYINNNSPVDEIVNIDEDLFICRLTVDNQIL